MGYIRHHAVIVTTFSKKTITEAHEKAKEIFGTLVSELVLSNLNGNYSFFVAPDGSKEGWPDSDQGNANRAAFIGYVKPLSGIDYVELFYGDDEGEAKIVSHN
jgi:hypothetical protein